MLYGVAHDNVSILLKDTLGFYIDARLSRSCRLPAAGGINHDRRIARKRVFHVYYLLVT